MNLIDHSHKNGILKVPELQKEFYENGFVKIPFLNTDQIQLLLAIFKKEHPVVPEGFFTTTYMPDVTQRERISNEVYGVVRPSVKEYFENFKFYFSSFISKSPGEKSELIVHQDMTLVDERQFSGVNIWCPLVDLTETNGAIQVLPKSHRFFKTLRGSSIPDIYDNVVPEVKQQLVPQLLKAGEAIVFDQSIIHYSPPNLSNEIRPVVNTFLSEEKSKIEICYWPGTGDEIEVYGQEDDFLIQFQNFGSDIFAKPTIGKLIRTEPYDFPKLKDGDLRRYKPGKINSSIINWLSQKLFQ